MTEYSKPLIAPDGRTVTAHSPSEYNDLRFGLGYRPADEEPQRAAPTEDAEPAEVPDRTDEPAETVDLLGEAPAK